jgi:hypothetical protein
MGILGGNLLTQNEPLEAYYDTTHKIKTIVMGM